MTELKKIFHELFRAEPLLVRIPNWSHLSAHDFVMSNGLDAPGDLHLAISARTDSQLHFYNDAFQSHISGLVTTSEQQHAWFSPMESLTRQMLKASFPIRGYNLYFSGMQDKKKGKSYELLMKTALAKSLNHLYALNLDRDELIRIICSSNQDSVLDALFLSQIIPQFEISKQLAVNT